MTGLWWRPELPAHQLAGTLQSRNGRLALQLIGSFDSDLRLAPNEKTPVIFGVAETKKLTLIDCFHTGTGLKVPGTAEQRFWPRFVLAGGHLSDGVSSRFKSLAAQATDLGPWLVRTPVTEAYKAGGDQKLAEISHVYQPSPPVSVELSKIRAQLRYGYSFETQSDRFRSIGFKIAAYLQLLAEEPQDIGWFHDHLQTVLDLQSLLIGRRTRIERLYAVAVSGREGGDAYDLVEDFPSPTIDKDRFLHEILVPKPKISDLLTEIFRKWFDQREVLREPTALLLGAEERLPGEVRLLILSQALESFHRNVHGGQYVTKEDYDPIFSTVISAIPDSVNSSLRESIRSRLEYGYQFSLRRRLTALLQNLEGKTLAALKVSQKDFVNSVKTARDFYTHWDRSSSDNPLSSVELWNLNTRLHAIARLVILKHIGVPEHLVLERMLSNRHLFLEEYTSLQ